MPDYLVQVAGPLGTTREFYDDIRKLMACKRKSWAGLLHPRKVTVHFVHNSIVQEEMPSAASASSATASGDQEPGDEAADDTDEGEPPCEADLFFMKLQNVATGKRLETPTKAPRWTMLYNFHVKVQSTTPRLTRIFIVCLTMHVIFCRLFNA